MEPVEREVKDFYFRQLRKVNVGDVAKGGASEGWYSLICTSNNFGITFVGCKSGVYAFKTSMLHTVDKDEDIGPQNVMADISCLQAVHIPTPSPPLDVALSSDELTLSVCLRDRNYLKCCFFATRILTKQGSSLGPFTSIAMTTQPDVHLCGLAWNPGCPEQLAVALSNATLALLEVKEDVRIIARKELPTNAMCWSPKGKQLAVGLKNGIIVQLKPSSQGFEIKKSFLCPDVFNGEPQQVTDLHWISSFLFAVVYTPQSPANSAPSFVFLSVPKNEAPIPLNFDDVFYGTGTKQSKFYFGFISRWNILISSSANAIESVVFSQRQRDGGGAVTHPWEKWELEDTGRAEVPLDEGNNETFPTGMALSYCSEEEIKINESTTLPPCPLLLLYTDHGVLCPFTIVNTSCSPDDIRALTSPPQPLPGNLTRQPVSPRGQASTTGAPQIPSSEPQRSSPLQQQQQRQPLMQSSVLSSGSFPFTPVSKPLVSTMAAVPPVNPKTGTAVAGPFSGLSFGGNKLGSGSGPPSFQFSVSSIAGGQSTGKTGMPVASSAVPTAQATHPLATSSSAPNRPQTALSPQSGPAGLAQPTGMTAASAGPQTPPSTGQPPPYGLVQPHSTPPQRGYPEMQPTLSKPATGSVLTSQPPPNVVMTSPGQLPAYLAAVVAAHSASALNQSILLGQPPLQSSTPLASADRLATGLGRPPDREPRPPPAYQASPPSYQMSQSPLIAQSQNLPPQVAPSEALIQKTQLAASRPSDQTAIPGWPVVSRPQLPTATPGQPVVSRPQLPTATPGQPVGTRPQLPTATPGQPVVSRPQLPTATPGQPVVSRPQLPTATPGQPVASRPQLPTATPGQPVASRPSLPMRLPGQPTSRPPPPATIPTGPPPTYSGITGAQEDEESVISENPDNIEALFSAHIQDEIEKFSDELEALKENMRDVFGEGWEAEGGGSDGVRVEGLGSMGDMQLLRENTLETKRGIREAAGRVKDLERRCGRMGDDGLRGFELAEEARANLKKKNDPNYAALLKLRPLDAYNARRLEEVRRSFLQVEQNVSEVNSQLDADLERRYEERRQSAGGRSPLKAPSVQTIYSTLRNHRQITRMQGASIEQVANKMKRLRLIPQSWHPSDPLLLATPPSTPLSPAREATPPRVALRPSFPEPEPEGGDTVDHEKVEKLRDHLSNIVHIPMQRVKPTGFTFTSERSGTGTPLQSSQWSGTETPQSTLHEDAISVPESDTASVTDYRPHHGALPRLPPSLLSSTRAPLHGVGGNGSIASIATPPQQIHHQDTASSQLLAAQQSVTSSLGSSLRSYTYSLPPGPAVIATSGGRIKVLTAEGYKTPPTETVASVPQERRLAHQSRKPGIILTSDQKFLVQTADGYNMATSRSDVPSQQPVQLPSSPGTVHWGSPPKPEMSQSQQQTGHHLENIPATQPGLSARLNATESPDTSGIPSKPPPSSLPRQGISTGPTLFAAPGGGAGSGGGRVGVPTGGLGLAAATTALRQQSAPSVTTQQPILPLVVGELRRTDPVSDLTKIHPAKGSAVATTTSAVAPTTEISLPKPETSQSILSSTPSLISSTSVAFTASSTAPTFSLGSLSLSADPGLTIKPSTGSIFSHLSGSPLSTTTPAKMPPQFSSEQKIASQNNTSSETAGATAPATSTASSTASGLGIDTLFASLPKLTPGSFNMGSGVGFQFGFPGNSSSTPSMKTFGPSSGSSNQPALSTGTTKTSLDPSFALGDILSLSSSSTIGREVLTGTGVITTTAAAGTPSIFGGSSTSAASSLFPSPRGPLPFKLTDLPQFGAVKSTSGEGTVKEREEAASNEKSNSETFQNLTSTSPFETPLYSQADASKSILGIHKPSSPDAMGIAGGKSGESLLQPPAVEGTKVTGEPAGKQGSETEVDRGEHKLKLSESAITAKKENDKEVEVEPGGEKEGQEVAPGMLKTGDEKLVEATSAASSLTTSAALALPPASVVQEPVHTSTVVATTTPTAPSHTSTSPSQNGDSKPAAVVVQVSEVPATLPMMTAVVTATSSSSSNYPPSSAVPPPAPGPASPPTTGTTSEGGVAGTHVPVPPLLQAGSQDSNLLSAELLGVEELEMDGMENDMEPIDVCSEQQPVAGGSMMGSLSFGGLGLGGKADSTNSSTNPFGTSLQPASEAVSPSSGLFQTTTSGGKGSSFIKPATGTFGSSGLQVQQQQTSPLGAGMGTGLGMGASEPVFGSGPMFGGASTIGGSLFGGTPLLGSQLGFGSPPVPSASGLSGRIFGVQTESSGSFAQSGGGELSFGSLAQQPSASGGLGSGGFGSGGSQSLMGPAPMTGTQFSSWR